MTAPRGGAGAAQRAGAATFIASKLYNLALAAAVFVLFGAAAIVATRSGMIAGRGAWVALAISAGLGFFGATTFLRNLCPGPATLTLDAEGFQLSRPPERFAWADCREVEAGAFFVPFAWPLDSPYVTFRIRAPEGAGVLEHRIVNIFEPRTADLAAAMEEWRRRACVVGGDCGAPRA